MSPDKVLSMIGMATKAGKVVSGEFAVEKEVKCTGACLVLIAEDASENTKKKFQNMCNFYEVPIRLYGTRETLGHAIGKEFRASIAVLDEGFTKSILKYLDR
ncbi:MAG: ribosomal L7Ae/L30e/S12e/Gadd45 family protein [Eubacteriales bacterium]|nr:ribosomal L7Ae/L30e/S12e/Gadd45 family protein [Eubacteriales bacterium]